MMMNMHKKLILSCAILLAAFAGQIVQAAALAKAKVPAQESFQSLAAAQVAVVEPMTTAEDAKIAAFSLTLSPALKALLRFIPSLIEQGQEEEVIKCLPELKKLVADVCSDAAECTVIMPGFLGPIVCTGVMHGRLKLVSHMIEQEKIPVNANHRDSKMTALHFAVIHEHVHVVRWLLQHGANPLLEDALGQRPRQYVKDQDIRQSLEEAEKIWRSRIVAGKSSKLHSQAHEMMSRITDEKVPNEQLITFIQQQKQSLNVQDFKDLVLGMGFVMANHPTRIPVLDYILREKMISIDEQSRPDGYTILHLAAQNNQQSIVDYLLQQGANPLVMNTVLKKAVDFTLDQSVQAKLKRAEGAFAKKSEQDSRARQQAMKKQKEDKQKELNRQRNAREQEKAAQRKQEKAAKAAERVAQEAARKAAQAKAQQEAILRQASADAKAMADRTKAREAEAARQQTEKARKEAREQELKRMRDELARQEESKRKEAQEKRAQEEMRKKSADAKAMADRQEEKARKAAQERLAQEQADRERKIKEEQANKALQERKRLEEEQARKEQVQKLSQEEAQALLWKSARSGDVAGAQRAFASVSAARIINVEDHFDDRNAALMIAVKNYIKAAQETPADCVKWVPILQLLVEKGAHIGQKNRFNEIPIQLATDYTSDTGDLVLLRTIRPPKQGNKKNDLHGQGKEQDKKR
jgi:ankyrin repeat protein